MTQLGSVMKAPRPDGGMGWSLAAFGLGLLLTGALAWWQSGVESRLRQQQLERLAENGFDAIDSQMRSAMLLVRLVQSVFLASEEVTQDEFQRVFENLGPGQSFPSLQALAFNRLVDDDPVEGPRFPVELVAPMQGNEALWNLDLATQPENIRAILRSRDSDRPVMSGAFPLVQFINQPTQKVGVVVRLPVFSPGPLPRSLRERRQRFTGSLVASFRLDSLIESALSPEALAGFDLHIFDISESTVRQLFDSSPPGQDQVEPGGMQFERTLELGTRRWRIVMESLADVQGGLSPANWLIIPLGVLASVLLALLVWSLLMTRNRALMLADRMSSQRQDSESRFSALNELLPALVMLADAGQGRLRQANRAARERLGVGQDALDQGKGPLLTEVFADPALVHRLLALDVADERGVSGLNTTMRLANGELSVSLSATAIELAGESNRLLVASDTSELLELNERLAYQASHDSLTGLINRHSFEERFYQLVESVNLGALSGALLYIDLDQFKVINDTCGHYAGDQLLAELANRLSASLKAGDILARLGGDEFGVLLVNVDSTEALAVAERARLGIDGFVFGWEQRSFAVTASIGVVMIDRPGMSQREVLAHADTACYMAKERGRNRIQLFRSGDVDTAQRRTEMEWATRLRQALAERRFVLDYQELTRLKPSRSEGGAHFELLVRLIDEDGNEVPPGAFIPAAERFGLMPSIDRWVVETALSNFDRLHPAGSELEFCAINLSGASVDDEKFAERVIELLDRYQVPAHKVCFEITETIAVSNIARVVRFMQRLRARGCRFALDDFGSGMASFGYLKDLPIDILKIDGSFIREIENDPANYSIVRAVTDIGHQVGLLVIAEWVDSPRAAELLRGIGVDFGQGFSLHRPERVLLHRSS